MDFKTYWQGLKGPEREALAKSIGTSAGYCHQIAYGDKHIELGLADAIVAHSGGDLTLADLPLTERALFQNAARNAGSRRAKQKAASRRAEHTAEEDFAPDSSIDPSCK